MTSTRVKPQTSVMSEIQIQAEAFQYVWNNIPETRYKIFHVPNGGSRNAIEGMQLKASGVVAGVPDIIFLWKGRAYGFEFKTSTGVLSHQQQTVHKAWDEENIPVYIIRSSQQFFDHIKDIICKS